MQKAEVKKGLVRAAYWFYAMVVEVLAFLGVFASRWVPFNRKTGGTGTPIFLIHGYLNGYTVWRFHKWMLEKRGFGPVYMVSLGHPFSSIRGYPEIVKREVERIAPGKKIILIGHSMGGLVSILYAAKLAKEGSVAAVMTIGSPLRGTPVAAWIGIGQNAKEMRRGSDLVGDIQKGLESGKAPLYHIAARCDELVVPGESALHGKDPSRNVLLEGIGHASLLFSKRVSDVLCRWLSIIE
jgi:triacylglycerol esterase/lipase EstA (alpha/beta hydrolase family)